MRRYEYMTFDLSAEPAFNVRVKMERYIEKLNEYGKQGRRLISGTEDWRYSVFEREIECNKGNETAMQKGKNNEDTDR